MGVDHLFHRRVSRREEIGALDRAREVGGRHGAGVIGRHLADAVHLHLPGRAGDPIAVGRRLVGRRGSAADEEGHGERHGQAGEGRVGDAHGAPPSLQARDWAGAKTRNKIHREIYKIVFYSMYFVCCLHSCPIKMLPNSILVTASQNNFWNAVRCKERSEQDTRYMEKYTKIVFYSMYFVYCSSILSSSSFSSSTVSLLFTWHTPFMP